MTRGLKLTFAFAGALSLLATAASAQDIKLPETMTFTAYDTGSSGFNIAEAVGKALKDKHGSDVRVLPAGNVTFVASQEAVDEAGSDFGETIENVQSNLSLEVMQELNARVDIDKEKPEDVAADYLTEFGYTE